MVLAIRGAHMLQKVGICLFAHNELMKRLNAKIYAELALTDGSGEIFITGGRGVGIVTKKGLQVPVGSYAINPAPQKIIRDNLVNILPKDKSALVKIGIVDGKY